MVHTSRDRRSLRSTLSRPKVLVLDVDDTLYLERDYVRSGFIAVGCYIRHEFAGEGFDAACWELFERGARGTIFNDALHRIGLPDERPLIQALVEVYRTHTPAIELLPDAQALLETARARGIAMGVISDGPLAAQERKVRALGLDSWVDQIILTDRWGREWWKPHVRAYTELEHHFGAGGPDCLYVGDNPLKDFLAPRRLGWQSVRIRRELGLNAQEEAAADSRPDTEWDDLTELARLIADGPS